MTALVTAQSSRLYHEVYTKQDGLELDRVRAMAFDTNGFLWLGGDNYDIRDIILTDKKLAIQRFDGANFHSFEIPETNGAVQYVNQIFKREDGKFYILGRGVFSLFDPISQEFETVPVLKPYFSEIFQYQGENYLLTQIDREITLAILNDDLTFKNLFSFTSSENRFLVESSTKIVFHKKGILISDDNFPLHFFDWDGTLLKRYQNRKVLSTKTGANTNFMVDEVFYKDNTIYTFMLNNRQLHKVDFETLEVRPVKTQNTFLNEETIYSYGNQENNIVLHTSGQDLLFNKLTDTGFKTTTARGVFNQAHSIKCASTNTLKDIWVGNGGGELHYFKFPSKKITVLLPEIEMRAIVPYQDDTYLICTEKKGWYLFNETTLDIDPFPTLTNTKKFAPNSSRNVSIEEDTIWAHGSGFYKINKKTRNASFYSHYPVLNFEPLNKDVFIYGTSGYHLMRFNKRTLQHDSIIKTDTLRIYDIAIHDSLVVGATDKGVLQYDFKTKKTNFFADQNILGDAYLLMVDYQEPHGFVFGARDGTISAYNLETKQYNILYKDALKAGIAKIVYTKSHWWINTFNGLVRYTKANGAIKRFSTKDGLSNNEGNRYSGLKTKKGILFGSIKGLNYFNPKDLETEEVKSQLKVLSCKKYNEKLKQIETTYNQEFLTSNSPIHLPAEHKELEITFALSHNVTQNEHAYRYRLNTNNWVEMGKDQIIRFVNLASGTYDLEIEAKDFTGNKIGESLYLKIDSEEFFYKTWWFYLGVFFASISLLLFLLYQARSKQKMQQRFSLDLLGSQENERNRIAKELHDGVGQQLTLIKRKSQHEDQQEITKLTNTVLEEVRSISRGLYPANLNLLGLTESIEQLVNEIDEQTPMFFSVELENIDAYFNQEKALHIYRFVQEALNNIIKHAQAKEVFVTIKKEATFITLHIEDNGKGFKFQQQHLKNSLGLKTLAERIKTLHGTLVIQSQPNKGTKLLVKIPRSL